MIGTVEVRHTGDDDTRSAGGDSCVITMPPHDGGGGTVRSICSTSSQGSTFTSAHLPYDCYNSVSSAGSYYTLGQQPYDNGRQQITQEPPDTYVDMVESERVYGSPALVPSTPVPGPSTPSLGPSTPSLGPSTPSLGSSTPSLGSSTAAPGPSGVSDRGTSRSRLFNLPKLAGRQRSKRFNGPRGVSRPSQRKFNLPTHAGKPNVSRSNLPKLLDAFKPPDTYTDTYTRVPSVEIKYENEVETMEADTDKEDEVEITTTAQGEHQDDKLDKEKREHKLRQEIEMYLNLDENPTGCCYRLPFVPLCQCIKFTEIAIMVWFLTFMFLGFPFLLLIMMYSIAKHDEIFDDPSNFLIGTFIVQTVLLPGIIFLCRKSIKKYFNTRMKYFN